jgi:hypothetical protein
VFVLSLHGAGSIGNWQRHYLPLVDLKEKYRLVVATPTAATSEPTRRWTSDADDDHLRDVVDAVYHEFGAANIRSFWLAGHSLGGITARRLVCASGFVRQPDVVDERPGYVTATDQSRGPSWGRHARPGTAEVYVYPDCRDRRVVADVVRLDKGHTEGLEPKVLEEIVKLMAAAPGGKARGRR